MGQGQENRVKQVLWRELTHTKALRVFENAVQKPITTESLNEIIL